MTKFREKAQGQVKQAVGQMIGDDKLVLEGQEHQRDTEHSQTLGKADQGIVKDQKGEEQPKDKERAQTVHGTDADKSVSKEQTRDTKARKGAALD